MNKKKNKNKVLTIVLIILLLIAVGVFVIVIVPRLTTTERGVAPTAPESKPAAAEWIGGDSCQLAFTISGGTPTPTPTDDPTATPTPTDDPTATPTPTATQLPEAGIGLPTLGALGGGVVMTLLGILLLL